MLPRASPLFGALLLAACGPGAAAEHPPPRLRRSLRPADAPGSASAAWAPPASAMRSTRAMQSSEPTRTTIMKLNTTMMITLS